MVSVHRWGLALIILMSVAGVAPAQRSNNEQAAKRAYQSGYKNLQAGKFADALADYRRSYELAPRPRTLFNMALCEERLGQEEEAFRHFTEFVATAEERDAEFVSQAQERLSVLGDALKGRVTVETDPPGAEVRVDGNRRSSGNSPLTLSLRPGEHYVHVSTPWSKPEERLVTVEPRGRATVRVALVPSSSVEILVEPADAIIERVGEKKPAKGHYQALVRPGTYQFTIRRTGFIPENLEVRVKRGASVEQTVRLRPRITNATLVVNADGATLAVDGNVAPSTGPRGRRSLAAGEHRLRVERDGYHPWETTLHLSPGESVTVDVDLARRHRSRWGWLGIGIGASGVIAGGVIGVLGLRDVTSDDADRHSRGKRRTLVADGLVVVGAVAIYTAWRYVRASSSSARVQRRHGGF